MTFENKKLSKFHFQMFDLQIIKKSILNYSLKITLKMQENNKVRKISLTRIQKEYRR